ncbi:MAG: hypothetical protein HUJ30_07110 [Gammaproteobacteria bacterium]|nr:hypothetical protein [Gammaproteobacteria bacterium]
MPRQDTQTLHRLHSIFTITRDGLKSGWLPFRQCHYNLDVVPALEVSYQYREINQLQLEHAHNIGKIWIEKQSVQMENISQGGEFCISANVRILKSEQKHQYMIKTGPFYRRFLDGYYPFHVIIDIKDPKQLLRLHTISPTPRPGISWQKQASQNRISAVFSGKLTLSFHFQHRDKR